MATVDTEAGARRPNTTTYRSRPVSADDLDEVVELCARSLSWDPTDPNAEFFTWKHRENPAGPSLGRVAVDPDGRIVAVRMFMRWRWTDPDGAVLDAVRAVDTATDPDHRRQGLFEQLTLELLDDLPDQGIAFVFNTPNDRSLPGYLKMGWTALGTPTVGMRLRRPVRPGAGSEWTGAAKWGRPTDIGATARAAFADDERTRSLVAATPTTPGYRTLRTPEYLRWRYSFAPLGYRVVSAGRPGAEGAVVFRLRQRGDRLDLTVCEELGHPRAARQALSIAVHDTRADLVLRSQRARWSGGFVRRPSRGQTLAWRSVDGRPTPSIGQVAATQGDLELF